jgi:hypothetical protein
MVTQKKKYIQHRKNRTTKNRLNQYEVIVKRLHPITEDKIISDYQKLQQLDCKGAIESSFKLRLGNDIVDYFTLEERLHTKTKHNIDFYTFWKKRKHYIQIPHIRKMLQFYQNRKIDEIRKYKYIFNLYFSSISIFKPVVAMELYCRVHAKRVLDFTMGWGGRLVAACVLNLQSYIGIDSNTHLKVPYEKLKTFLRQRNSTTDITLYFQDALLIDYSTMDYDTVFTSLPYYNTEIYRGNQTIPTTKEKWFLEFYKPLYEKTWKHLKKGGCYCLNVSQEIYQETCIPVLGKCDNQFLLKKNSRTEVSNYKEYIYVWNKSTKRI